MISLHLYRKVLGRSEIRSAFLASIVGRIPIGMTGLGILLLCQSESGSFAYAGATVACYIAGLATMAPFLGRIIDRSGPRRVLWICGLIYPSTLLALCGALITSVAPWTVAALATVTGAGYPPITVCMRTFFRQRLAEEQMLSSAYSLESVLIETVFVIGPLLVAWLVAAASPALAVSFAAICGFAGVFVFLGSPALSHWKIERHEAGSIFGPMAEPGFAPLLAVVLCYSGAFGLVEIGLTAFAAEIGHPALAGVFLGLMSLGSALGGLAYGSRSWRTALSRQFSCALALIGAGVGILALVRSPWLFAALSMLSGVVMAPALTVQAMLVARTAPARFATEAFTWSATALLGGIGAGMAAGGLLLERASSAAVLGAAGAVAGLGAAAALGALRRG
jgi:hypothetical protein